MLRPKEFIKQVEIFLNTRIGAILTGSVLKNNASKLNTVPSRVTKDDAKAFIDQYRQGHIVVRIKKHESKLVKAEPRNFTYVRINQIRRRE